MMVFAIAAVKIIHPHKIVWLKGIRELIGNNEIPIATKFIGVIIILFAIKIS